MPSLYAVEDSVSALKTQALKQVNFSQNLKDIINGHASAPLSLSDNDKEALKLLGYSDNEIASLTISDLGDKEQQQLLSQRVNNYANKKNTEITQGVEKDVVPGLASAVIGLAFSSLLGVVIGVKCSNQPSALVFAGTSAAWAALEMMIWKGYKINMKDIETLTNATTIPNKMTKEVEEMKAIIASIEKDIKNSSEDTYESALSRNEEKLKKLKQKAQSLRDYLNKAKDSQFGAIRRIQESLELAAETSQKKSKNAKIAAIGFTAAAGVATAESFKSFSDGGKCFTSGMSYQRILINKLLGLWVPSAHAAFANVADLDKIGIPLGAGLGAAYIHFEKTFANKIFNSAPSRAAIFLAMAGIAYYASMKLQKASEFLRKQANEMDVFATSVEEGLSKLNSGVDSVQSLIYEIKDQLLPAYDELVESIKNNEDIQETLEGIKGQVADAKEQALSADVQALIGKELSDNEKEIGETIEKGKSELSDIDSSEYVTKKITSLDFLDMMEFFIPTAHAAYGGLRVTPSCFKRGRSLPVMDEDCSCLKKRRCLSSRFPSLLKIKKKGAFVELVTQNAFKASKASDLILSGKPRHGLLLFKKLAPDTQKIEKSSLALLNSRVSKTYNPQSVLKLTKVIRNSTKEGLGDYFQKSKGSPVSLASVPLKIPSKNKSNRDKVYTNPILSRLKKDVEKAKSLGNLSVAGFQVKRAPREDNGGYDYAQETIIRDPNVDIFLMIKKRYMQVRADGRL